MLYNFSSYPQTMTGCVVPYWLWDPEERLSDQTDNDRADVLFEPEDPSILYGWD